jgi:carboxymethylenebutenolidase
MCHATNARPPPPPISGGAGPVAGQELVLTSEDGTRFSAYTATTETPGGAGIVILPDVRGLHPFYVDLAQRFAEAGVHATAFDYFGRTAGLGVRGEEFDHMPHVRQTRPDTIAQDVAAAVNHVRSNDGGAADAIFTVGFCFGGRNSFNQGSRGHGLAGVIGFYGRVAQNDRGDADAPILRASTCECPVLGLFGGADRNISTDDVEAYRHALDQAGVPNELVVYDGAPHSFFDRAFDRFRNECDDAWRRVLGFIESNTARLGAKGS